MTVVQTLSVLALRQLLGGACKVTRFKLGEGAVDGVINYLTRHFTDHSQRLLRALAHANDRAWKALEVALAGETWWDRCVARLASGEVQAFRRQVQAFLDASPLDGVSGGPDFRPECLRQLRAARQAGVLTSGALSPRELAHQAGQFARFASPQDLLDAEWQAVENMADELRQANCAALSRLLATRTPQGLPLLVTAVRYFFRRAVETDAELARGLAFAQVESLGQAQEAGLAALADAFEQHGQRLESLLKDVQLAVVQTHGAVLDIQAELRHQGEQHLDLYEAVIRLQTKLDLLHRELRPCDSLSIRTEDEGRFVKQLVVRYRALPAESRCQLPALLNALGKLEVAAGEFADAERCFEAVAAQVSDAQAQAEAHFNAYHAALERRDWDKALAELREAVALGGPRFTLFPTERYHAERILGAGGFGVVFLSRQTYSKARVVIKALRADDLGRDLDAVFAEASALEQVDHPAIIRLRDCGYADAERHRPYLVMDYFDGVTLDEHVRRYGPLPMPEFAGVACQMAAGLQAAHAQDILHRDVKPGNVLLQQTADGWRVKLIDFGLALRRQAIQHTLSNAEAVANTVLGSSIAGTIDYAAPEQMGKLRDTPVWPYSDVYGFGKTCCYALFGTPQPGPKQWRQLTDERLIELLGDCLAEQPEGRPANFAAVLDRLSRTAGGECFHGEAVRE